MGKPKKGSQRMEDDSNLEEDEINSTQAVTNAAGAKKKEKGKKNKKRKDDDDEMDDIEKELQAMALEANAGREEVVEEYSLPTKKEKVKKKGKSAFELLAELNDDEDDDSSKKSDKDSEAETDDVVLETVVNPTEKKKESKKKEKHKKAEEDDLDALIAHIENTAEKPEKSKNKKKVDESNEVKNTTSESEQKENDSQQETDKKLHEEKDEEEESTVKSAAQKRKEKKERERQKKQLEKQKEKKKTAKEVEDNKSSTNIVSDVATPGAADAVGVEDEAENKEDDSNDSKKKKKKKKGEKEEKETKKPTKQIAFLKEQLKKMQEEEQKAKEEQERREREEEERIRLLEEQKRLEEEKKLKKKQKKKEREERLKKEGKFLTEKQKQDKRRLEQMLAARQEAGEVIPDKDSMPRKRPVYGKKKKPQDNEKSRSPSNELPSPDESVNIEEAVQEREEVQEHEELEEDIKDDWDADTDEEESEDSQEIHKETQVNSEKNLQTAQENAKVEVQKEQSSNELNDDDENDEDEDESSDEESDSDSDNEMLTSSEKGKDKVQKRHEAALKKRTADSLRAPVVCVLGHVDTGKTKILDKLRRTNVQDGEAGGITQQIGATNVPMEAIHEKTKMCKEFSKLELKLPGLLIIDTPGHESFRNLRIRGSSLCDIAILVIDIMHGLEPQTIESIHLLKEKKTPFVVALNKIDRLYQWKPQPMADVQNTIKKQTQHTKNEFDERTQLTITQLAQEGLNACLFYDNKNPREYVSLVPTSAHTGDGMGNLVALVCELCQSMLVKRLMCCEDLSATIMEVKAIHGLGFAIDVILINGSVKEGDTIVLAGSEGPIVTQIRGLLMPPPMKEIRIKGQLEHHKVVKAAQGVKIIAKDLEKALAGFPLYVAYDNDEMEYYKEEVADVLKETLLSIRVQDRGVFVQASTLGSLEALLDFLKESSIPYAGINIGPVHKKDIMKASVMLEHDSQYAVILAFDVKVEREAQELADNLGVRIFTADIIYHLFDAFTKYRQELKQQKQEEFKHIAVFPCKLRVLPQFIFNSRDPIVVGVSVEAGFVKEGTPVCVPSKEFLEIGRISSLEFNNKPVETARQGQEICIKINALPGDAPKMFGRHFDETDLLVSKISRESIDAVKNYFRDDMLKSDWKLMLELKKQFEIL